MRNKNILKRISMIFFCLSILLSILPITVNAATTSVPGAEGEVLTDILTGTFEGGYDSTIIVYTTPNVSDSIQYIIRDNMGVFAVPTYDNANWYFAGWKTWYKGSHSGLGVTTSDKANPKYDDDENYFTVLSNGAAVEGLIFPAGSMNVLKEDLWKGTYYLSAIFKPILTVNAGEGVSYTISGGSKVADNKYAVTYGGGASIDYTITDNRYKITEVSASYGTAYSNSNGTVNVNTMERPATITIQTELKSKATYTAPTAKNLTYNNEQQELVNKGTSSEGTLMYSLEENGTYSENVPKAKDVGDYTVWYYVKGDNDHNDSDKQFIKVTILSGITDIGTVTAEIPNDTTDISKVVLKRTNTVIAGSLEVKPGQSLAFGDNEIEYIFTPEDDFYKTVEGKVIVTVTDTIEPLGTVSISGAKPTVWNKLLETITFGLFFNKDQMVEVNANDNLSGVDKIEYYESKEALDLDSLKSLADDKWKIMSDNSVKVTAEDGKQFVYYIRITDKAGNGMIISTDGAVFDKAAPTIKGVQDGKTYNTTKTITVTDKNLASVKLNGEDVEDKMTLKNNKSATYKIVAIDKAGNTSSITIKMKNPAENNPQTSDNITLFVIIAFVSVLGIITTIKFKKYIKDN